MHDGARKKKKGNKAKHYSVASEKNAKEGKKRIYTFLSYKIEN